MTGWRIGWLTGPADMITLLVSLNLVTTYGLNDFVSHAAAEALENGYGVKEIAERYAARRTSSSMRCAASTTSPCAARRAACMSCSTSRPSSPTTRSSPGRCSSGEGRASMPGSSFGEAAAGHIRISLCQPDAILQEAAHRLRRFASTYRSKAA